MPFSVTSLQVVFEDIKYLLVIFHLQDTIARISSRLTIARSCNLCVLVRHLASICACLYVLIEIVQNIIKQFYITWMWSYRIIYLKQQNSPCVTHGEHISLLSLPCPMCNTWGTIKSDLNSQRLTFSMLYILGNV